MPYEIAEDVGEKMLFDAVFAASPKSEPIRLAISDQALYLPRKKAFAVKDPTYTERVPRSNLVEIRIRRIKPYLLWCIATIMIVIGTYTTVMMMAPVLRGDGGKVSGYPPAIVVIGFVIPFISSRRFSLDIKTTGKPFRWKPELLVDKKSRNNVDGFLNEIADTCRTAGLPFVDERI